MTAQPDLFSTYNGSAPYVSHSETSLQAAEQIEPSAATLRAKVLACLKAHPEGLTDEQLQELTGMEGNTERPRRRELELAGKIRKGEARRRTSSGRMAVVWVAVAV